MIFNSLDFAIFLPIVFFLYWFVFHKTVARQNILVVVASYMFYGWWDYRFLALILFSTIVDFGIGRLLLRTDVQKKRKLLLGISISTNLGLLGFFKYYNFFADSFVDVFRFFGQTIQANTLDIILPVGISFYTFQTLSYTIDVYRKKLEPTSNFIEFAAFVSFFPQLVAGPIERATNLLPQFRQKRVFKYAEAMDGVYLVIWGLFKKVVIADNCAFFVNQIFNTPGQFSSLELFLGAVLFGFQIYGDFSGYSDIAIGTSRLFGLKLLTNFRFPYFSRDIAEFWRRWHISLSNWFRDYLYIPLGGSRGSKREQIRNVFIIFLVSGLWHGANWTYVIWGGIHAILFLPLILFNAHKKYLVKTKMTSAQIPFMLLTFIMVTIAWIYFRSNTVDIANAYLGSLFYNLDVFSLDLFYNSSKSLLFSVISFTGILILLIMEFLNAKKGYEEVRLSFTTALGVMIIIVFMGAFKNPQDFIYFQF